MLTVATEQFIARMAFRTDSNHAKLVDVGVNWYLNQFVKLVFDWEHAIFGSPVFSSTGQFQPSSDLFWFRTQLFF